MYSKEPYTGADLPPKVLCLTYDDGPGKNTYEIARFLYEHSIQATFFVVGKYAFYHQDVLEKVANFGHLIGNHTCDHPDMPYYLSINGDVHHQILRTDAVIKKHIIGDMVYFRSPYGKWSDDVADELNRDMLSTINHLGPIHWDIGGVDCYYWKNGRSVDETVKKYLEDIEEKGKGIIVMHDEIADMDYLKNSNHTFELTKQLIPLLKMEGYEFVRLDEIASVKKDAAEVLKFTLKATNGKFVTLAGEHNNAIQINGKPNSILNEISMEELGHGKIALKASNGLYFSLKAEKNAVIEAVCSEVNECEMFDVIRLSSRQIALRAYNGNFLARERRQGSRLLASAPYMRGCERFSFSPVSLTISNNITLREKYKMLKRQLLYVKSKIQQGA